MTECIICYKPLNENVKRFVCRKCHINVCIPCFKETIERGLYVPTCCSCRTPLNYDDIIEATSKTYFKTRYIDHLGAIQFKMLTEQTIQVLYPLIYKINNLNVLNITQLDIYAAKLFNHVEANPTFAQRHLIYQHAIEDFENFLSTSNITNRIEFQNDVLMSDVCKELEKLEKLVPSDLFKPFLQRHWQIDEQNVNINNEIDKLINKKTDDKVVAKCEKCKLGVIVEIENVGETKYQCNSCKQEYCSKCMMEIGNQNTNTNTNQNSQNSEIHKCKQEDIDSWEEIKKSTKLCPKCSSRIFRSQGCPQMFCTNCHTGFDWNTGKVINGNFHNPHRMEWIRNGRPEDNEIDCNTEISKIESICRKVEIPYCDEIIKLYNYHNELNDEIRKYTREYNSYSKINYYDLLRWYYKDTKTTLFRQINEMTYKDNIRSQEKSKFKYSTILSIITPINDIIHDGISTIINVFSKNYSKAQKSNIPKIINLNSQNSTFDNTNISILESKTNEPQYFEEIRQIFKNMINELTIFDSNLYSIEKVIDKNLTHYMFYSIPEILTGYSINLSDSGFETLYQLYFILNELTNIKPEWKTNSEVPGNKELIDKFVDELLNKYPNNKIKQHSKSSEMLKCKYLATHYKNKIHELSIIYTQYLTELQKAILIKIIRDEFHFTSDVQRNNVNRNRNRNLLNGEFIIIDDEEVFIHD